MSEVKNQTNSHNAYVNFIILGNLHLIVIILDITVELCQTSSKLLNKRDTPTNPHISHNGAILY